MKGDRAGSTYLAHAQATALDEAGGRFAAPERRPTVVGAKPTVEYPQMESGPWSKNELPDEPLIDGTSEGDKLGYRIDGGPEEPSSAQPEATRPSAIRLRRRI